ncbi:PREDICTED: derlin-1-like [Rhagoletis zephyria]|uniref:derlin-1-like n=1 Tax=Rhagoletis zephyria TaxID=28612 RepID=UPI00081159B9|nr:PREDICTED: derlin-1-like [Rhagoletis zephyria]
MTDPGQWYKQLPRLTRYWLTATVVLSLLTRFDILPLESGYLSRDAVWGRLQLWRCVTALFVYPLTSATGFHFLINCYFISRYIAQLEKEQFGRSLADYLYMLLIVAVLAHIGGMLFNVYFLMDLLVVSTTNIWCQLNKDVIVNFWFGTRFKAVYLPWVLVIMELVFQGSIASLIGTFIGHFYYFFKFQYPQEFGGGWVRVCRGNGQLILCRTFSLLYELLYMLRALLRGCREHWL